MSIVSFPASHSTVVSEPCWRCGRPTPSDYRIDPHYCPTCARSDAENEARKLLADVEALIAGTDVFACLPVVDRVDQLVLLGLSLEQITGRLSDHDLITLAGTATDNTTLSIASAAIVERLDGSPDAGERAAIEQSPDYASIDASEFGFFPAA